MIASDHLHRAARLHGPRPLAICSDEVRTYAEIELRTNRLANALLASGLQVGDRVGTWLENSIRCLELDFALAKAGLVRVSLNPKLSARESEFILADAQAKAFFHDASFDAGVTELQPNVPNLKTVVRIDGGRRQYEDFLAGGGEQAPGVRFDPEHLYCLFYTSGTTGRPKGVMLSHRAILQVSYNLCMEIGPWET
ncbi:MAG: AMP-binding protein, partial [Betaproteobacteria bacterium]|nr:AMP-binding protein [Betaproteobacteria bacterium]